MRITLELKQREDAMKTREGAEIYAEQVLTNLERDLTQLQQVVKNGQVYMEKLRTESYGNYDIPSSYEMRNSSSGYAVLYVYLLTLINKRPFEKTVFFYAYFVVFVNNCLHLFIFVLLCYSKPIK